MWEKLIYFHAFSPMDLRDFDELNFPNGKPTEPTGPFNEPKDMVANFGMYKGSYFSNILLTHFSYYCWALRQDEPHSGLQDFIDYCDVQLHDNKVRVTSDDRERFNKIKDSRKAPNRLEQYRPDSASRASPGTPSTVPDPADFKPQTFYRTLTSLEYTSFMKNHTIPVRGVFNTTNLHFEKMASLHLTCQQMSQANLQKDEETLYIVGVELDLNHF
eukprot:9805496-Alexandrium_andersonii.AAC.1